MTKETILKLAQIKGAVQVLDQIIKVLTDQRTRLQQQFDELQEVGE
jgi:hypothetical protein